MCIRDSARCGHDYTIGTLDVLQACDACADMGMTYSVIAQCTDCVVFPMVRIYSLRKSVGLIRAVASENTPLNMKILRTMRHVV